MVSKLSYCCFFFLAAGFIQAADFEVDDLPEALAGQTREFLKADTAKARAGMAAFSDDDLHRVTNAFKKAHDKKTQRIFWLSEELYRRNAERVAAERIRYLYYAVLAALGIIAAFSMLTYARSRNVARATPAMVAPNPAPQIITEKKKTGSRKARPK
jgi:hypothetical protein